MPTNAMSCFLTESKVLICYREILYAGKRKRKANDILGLLRISAEITQRY